MLSACLRTSYAEESVRTEVFRLLLSILGNGGASPRVSLTGTSSPAAHGTTGYSDLGTAVSPIYPKMICHAEKETLFVLEEHFNHHLVLLLTSYLHSHKGFQ